MCVAASASASPASSRSGSTRCCGSSVAALDPGRPGQFFMLEAPGRVLPRPMSLCLAPPGELAFLIDPIGPGTRALCELEPGDELDVFGPLGNGFDLDVERPLLVGGGIGIAPLPYLSEALGLPPAVLGFRSDAHAEAAALLPHAEVVVDPMLVTELHPGRASTCSRAGRSRCWTRSPSAARAPSSPGRRRWPAATARATAARSRSTASGSASAWKDRSLLLLNASGCLDALTAPEVARQLDAS